MKPMPAVFDVNTMGPLVPVPSLAQQAQGHAIDAALDAVEQDKRAQIAFEATTDKTAEVSVQGEKGRLSGAVYAKAMWGLTKDYVAGVRGVWTFRKR